MPDPKWLSLLIHCIGKLCGHPPFWVNDMKRTVNRIQVERNNACGNLFAKITSKLLKYWEYQIIYKFQKSYN
jgi:hypothetical protein